MDPLQARIDVFPECVELLLHDESVGIFDRRTTRAWLDEPGRPLEAGQASLAVGDDGRLVISLGADVIHSPLLARTTEQLIRII